MAAAEREQRRLAAEEEVRQRRIFEDARRLHELESARKNDRLAAVELATLEHIRVQEAAEARSARQEECLACMERYDRTTMNSL